MSQLSREALIDYGVKVGDLSKKIAEMSQRVEMMESEVAVVKSVNKSLVKRIEQLEKTQTKVAQYSKNRQLEIHRVPEDIPEQSLKSTVCAALSLTENEVTEDDLDKCHRLKRCKTSVIVEFHSRSKRDPVVFGRKKLKMKKSELAGLKMDKIIIGESLCDEYQRLDFICRVLKRNSKIGDSWFFMGLLYVLQKNGEKTVIRHINDLCEIFGHDYIYNILRKDNA